MYLRCCLFFALAVLCGRPISASAELTEPESAPPPPRSTVLDMVVAVIGDEPLTGSELQSFVRERGGEPIEDLSSGEKTVRLQLRDMILSQLIQREAEEVGVRVQPEEVDFYIAEIKQQNGVNDEQFTELLQAQRLTLANYRKVVRDDILKARLLNSVINEKIQVVDEDVFRYLDENPELLPTKGKVHLEQVFVPFPAGLEQAGEETADARDELKRRVYELREEAAQGKKLRELAPGAYTDLGYVAPADLREELAGVVSEMKPGELSQVIRTDSGFYVVLLLARFDGKDSLNEQFKDDIRQTIFQARSEQAAQEYLNDELPKKYQVDIKL